jgi:hypothetical protein
MFVVENDMCMKVKHYHNSHAWCQAFYFIRTTQFSLRLDYPWPSRVSYTHKIRIHLHQFISKITTFIFIMILIQKILKYFF